MKKKPLVTVYIPTYNRLGLLQRAVSSVSMQNYENIELIVVDDGSTDGTVAYLDRLAMTNAKIRYFVNERNAGACVSRNRAIYAARGEFITGLDDDDFFLPERVSQFVSEWESGEGVRALYTDAQIKISESSSTFTNRPKEVTLDTIVISNYVGNQIFCPTKELREIGGFCPEIKVWQDIECWIRLLSVRGCKFKKVGGSTYVVDKSHPHETITGSKRLSVLKTYEHISLHNAMCNANLARLEIQLLTYSQQPIGVTVAVRLVVASRHLVSACKIGTHLIRGWAKNMLKGI